MKKRELMSNSKQEEKRFERREMSKDRFKFFAVKIESVKEKMK